MERIGRFPFFGGKREQRRVEEPSPGQIAMARVSLYLYLLDVFEDQAKQYVAWRGDTGIYAHARTRQVFEDVYFARNNPVSLDRLQGDWGRDFDVFNNRLSQLMPSIDKKEKEFVEDVQRFRNRDIIWFAWKMGRRMPKMSREQRTRVFEIAGYPEKERRVLVDKLKTSGVLSLAGTGVAYAMLAMGEGAHVSSSLLEQIPLADAAAALGISYITHYASIALKAQQNIRLLRDPIVQNSADVVATGAFLLLRKFLPQESQLQDRTTRIIAFAPTASGEFVWRISPFLNFDPSVVTVRNLSGTLYNLLYSGVAEAFIRINRKRQQPDS